jgi:adenylate cyclase
MIASGSKKARRSRRDGDAMISLAVEDREAIWQRQLQRMRIGLSAANLIGAVTVFVFLRLLVPVPSKIRHDTGLLALNISLFVLVGTLATVIANTVGPRTARELREWFLSGGQPDETQRDEALRQPLVQTRIDGMLWLAAGAVFVTVNAFYSITIALQAVFMIALGGIASCALTYLLTERFTREVTATALAGGAPREAAGPGVRARVLVVWGIAAAIPLLGGGLLAISTLTVGHWSADRVAVSLLILSGVGLLLGFIAMVIAGHSIVDPVEVVREGLRRVRGGDLTTELPVYDGSEIGLLQAGFNEMTAGLREREQIRQAFGIYLDHEVAAHILAAGTALEGEEVEVTAMFIDIRDFTGFAERATAREVVTAVNSLFERVVPIVHAHGGHVDKFVGDGLLAVFGAPRRQPNHADEALAAALEIERAIEGELPAGIGLSSGRVIAGNVGGAGRLEFSVIGDAVNVADRVEAATRLTGDTVLVSAHTRALLSDASGLEERPSIPLKGKTELVALFAPRVRQPPGPLSAAAA